MKFIPLSITLIITIIALTLLTYKKTNSSENKLCTSTLKYSINDEGLNFSHVTHYRLFLAENGSGYVNLGGNVTYNNKNYIISRIINFTYKPINQEGDYSSKIDEVMKTGQDNIPDDLVNKFFIYTTLGVSNYFKVGRIDEHRMLISVSRGPFIVCSDSL
ncbi:MULTISPECIES: hypothetical protein [unclassified Serratia (in: enterobacteria)]|uniref:hypothetical protein n=1 Tax=unclassified Serratia (in: enterobacteria) TaxID=2647522 RepID=UPI0009077D3C|nr:MULTISPECIES: hypothetical protein [unclassified Serratia (in: enterobacteria)]